MKRLIALAVLLGAAAPIHAQQYIPNADAAANAVLTAPRVPPVEMLPSMPRSEWCRIADLALGRPDIEKRVREGYIRAGQANGCPQQLALPAIPPRPPTPEEWCRNSFGILNSPTLDPFVKQAFLEKMRNRGCLQ